MTSLLLIIAAGLSLWLAGRTLQHRDAIPALAGIKSANRKPTTQPTGEL